MLGLQRFDHGLVTLLLGTALAIGIVLLYSA